MNNRIPIQDHLALPWRVHQLAVDYEVEDVWRFPVVLRDEHDLATFRDQMTSGIGTMNRFNPARVLLALRVAIGRRLGWDQVEAGTGRQLRARYAAVEGLTGGEKVLSGAEFAEVYDLGNEYLSEIENRTVQAALHLGRVPTGDGTATVHLTVYVKPKGWLGRMYMWAIKPFRLWVVYPAILRAASRRWAEYVAAEAS